VSTRPKVRASDLLVMSPAEIRPSFVILKTLEPGRRADLGVVRCRRTGAV